jgi:hypothetical protein
MGEQLSSSGGVLGELEDETAQSWLEKTKPKLMLRPAAKLCVEKALKFLPKLQAGLVAARAAAEGEEEEDDDMDDLFD